MKKEESKKTTTKKTTKKPTATKKPATKVAPKKSTKKEEVKKVEPKKVETKKKEKEVKVTKVTPNKKETLETMFDTSYKSMMIIVIVTLLIIGLAIGIASIVKKNQKKTIDTSNAVIQYDEILLGNLLEQSNNAYYVLVYSKDDKNLNTYNTYLSNYKTKDNSLRVYYSVLENGFNKKYVSDAKNYFVSNIDDLKLMSTTLLKVEGKKVIEAYDGKDSIISQLKKINN